MITVDRKSVPLDVGTGGHGIGSASTLPSSYRFHPDNTRERGGFRCGLRRLLGIQPAISSIYGSDAGRVSSPLTAAVPRDCGVRVTTGEGSLIEEKACLLYGSLGGAAGSDRSGISGAATQSVEPQQAPPPPIDRRPFLRKCLVSCAYCLIAQDRGRLLLAQKRPKEIVCYRPVAAKDRCSVECNALVTSRNAEIRRDCNRSCRHTIWA
jgi:hypothetical protein